jgi:hypothetical protein
MGASLPSTRAPLRPMRSWKQGKGSVPPRDGDTDRQGRISPYRGMGTPKPTTRTAMRGRDPRMQALGCTHAEDARGLRVRRQGASGSSVLGSVALEIALAVMSSRFAMGLGFALVAACGGSVTAANDGGIAGAGGEGGAETATGDASITERADDASGDEGANETSSPGNVVDNAPPCGGAGQACCPGMLCGPGVSCVGGICSTPTCGASGQSCCGTSCNTANTCIVVDMISQCQACGQPGQPCCSTMPPCANAADGCFGGSLQYCMNNGAGTLGQPGDQCTTTCADPADTCVRTG